MFIVVLMHACNLLVQSAGITHDTTRSGLFFVPYPLGFVRGSGTGQRFSVRSHILNRRRRAFIPKPITVIRVCPMTRITASGVIKCARSVI